MFFFKIAILLFEEFYALGNHRIVPKKLLVIFIFSFCYPKHNFVTANMIDPPVSSWDLEISNSVGQTLECYVGLHFSAHKLLYHILSHAKCSSYNQKDT